MNIEYTRQQLMMVFLRDKRRGYIIIGVVLFTLICSLVIHNIQNKKVRLLLTRKEGEVKKSALLNQINLSGKTIELYRDAFRPRDVFLVMGAVGDTAKSSGVKMVSIKPGEEEDKPLYYRQY
ncbi:MAG: hypothetical protein WC301_06920, partial [Candidatus Omnitrophota bacterium]